MTVLPEIFSFQLTRLHQLTSLHQLVNYNSSFPTPELVPEVVSLYLSLSLSNLKGGGLPFVVSSLVDP